MACGSVKLAFLIMENITDGMMVSFKYGGIFSKDAVKSGIIFVCCIAFVMIIMPIIWFLVKAYENWESIILFEGMLSVVFAMLSVSVQKRYKNRKRVISSLKNAIEIKGYIYNIYDGNKPGIRIKFYIDDKLMIKETKKIVSFDVKKRENVHIFYSFSNDDIVIFDKIPYGNLR